MLVTAAFIGPGTVATASVAGARFGYALLWALVFSVFATLVLQEMSARVGLVSGGGLGEALRATVTRPLARSAVSLLVVVAIGFGNAAFQMGNVTGAALGLEALTGVPRPAWALVIGAAAFGLLFTGVYRWIERSLLVLVALLSAVFLATAAIVQPSPLDVATGALVPTLPPGSLLTVVALIGTTVVPYNLFLHASAVREKWSRDVPIEQALRRSRLDTVLSIALGGLVTLSIVVTASVFFERGTAVEDAAGMAGQLEPLLGAAAHHFFATGLLAAGLTSAVTAPLAAAYATSGVLGWSGDLRERRFRSVWGAVVLVGTALATLGLEPVPAIVLAQAANGLLLPGMAVFLLVVSNRRRLLGAHRNGPLANLLGAAVALVVTGLAILGLLDLVGGLSATA
jgi:manganese transport protein